MTNNMKRMFVLARQLSFDRGLFVLRSAAAPLCCGACTAKIRLISHRDRDKPMQRLQWP